MGSDGGGLGARLHGAATGNGDLGGLGLGRRLVVAVLALVLVDLIGLVADIGLAHGLGEVLLQLLGEVVEAGLRGVDGGVRQLGVVGAGLDVLLGSARDLHRRGLLDQRLGR